MTRGAWRSGRQRRAHGDRRGWADCSVVSILLIIGQRSVKGWYSGTSIDSQDTLKFSASAGVRSMNEVFPLERVAEAYERMMSGKARFRVVLKMEG